MSHFLTVTRPSLLVSWASFPYGRKFLYWDFLYLLLLRRSLGPAVPALRAERSRSVVPGYANEDEKISASVKAIGGRCPTETHWNSMQSSGWELSPLPKTLASQGCPGSNNRKLALILAALYLFRRMRRNQSKAAQQARKPNIRFSTRAMVSSGVYMRHALASAREMLCASENGFASLLS